MTTYLLNSPVLTGYGDWRFSGPLEPAEAAALLAGGYRSAIGHESSAQLLSLLLGQTIPAQRTTIRMEPGDRALVLRVMSRLPEGILLDFTALSAIPWELSLLERLS